jgi:hypothetical protein
VCTVFFNRVAGAFLLAVGSVQMSVLLLYTIRQYRKARELLADLETEITFRDSEVQLYRPGVKIREEISVYGRPAKLETTIRPGGYVLLPSWIMNDPPGYGLHLPPPGADNLQRQK